MKDLFNGIALGLLILAIVAGSFSIGHTEGEMKIKRQAAQLGHAVWIASGSNENTFYWLNPQKDRIQQAMEMYEANK